MSLRSGDLTTQQNASLWLGSGLTLPSPILGQLITRMSAMIYSKLNRARLYSQTLTRTFDGLGNASIVLPDWPVTSITALQQGSSLIPPSILISPTQNQPPGTNSYYGYRYVPWNGNLPGDPAVIEYVGGYFYTAQQNVKVTYVAGYLTANEPATVPLSPGPYVVTVLQEQGLWSRDNGVVYVNTGVTLTPVATNPTIGQYVPPSDTMPGIYTFSALDASAALLISYSFIPPDLEEACIQMVAERYAYRNRVGEISKSLGGQETIRFARGNTGPPWNNSSSLPPEVMDLINPYISVLSPAIGSPT